VSKGGTVGQRAGATGGSRAVFVGAGRPIIRVPARWLPGPGLRRNLVARNKEIRPRTRTCLRTRATKAGVRALRAIASKSGNERQNAQEISIMASSSDSHAFSNSAFATQHLTSHPPTDDETQDAGFKSRGSAQRFLSVHAAPTTRSTFNAISFQQGHTELFEPRPWTHGADRCCSMMSARSFASIV